MSANNPGLVIVVSGPGGVGKSTIVEKLVQRDAHLWLSRSWTTREQRPGEAADAYRFVTRQEFEDNIAANGFLEWTDFLGNLYGTPMPNPPIGKDVVLEIEVDGAQQVKRLNESALLLFVLPPSRQEQKARLRGRGDADQKVEKRLRKAEEEEPVGKAIADYVIINDDLESTLEELSRIIAYERNQRTPR
ncbi:MAG: guanylate kinase [Actinomycetota bacterium]|nr:guanylate kinase [Actinomycetota bacterium]MDA3003457.1 guanylate kinase [Actinomycetota bacterium]